MSDTKFTKGEYLVAGETFVYALNEKGVNQFCFNVQGNGRHGAEGEELKSNAYLFAQANAMYEMLEECLSEMINLVGEADEHRMRNVNGQTESQPDMCDQETLHRIQLLLAKARGE